MSSQIASIGWSYLRLLGYAINGFRMFPWIWALAGTIAGVTLTFTLLLVGFLILAFGVYSIILGGVIGTTVGVFRGINLQRKRGLRSTVNTADRPFY